MNLVLERIQASIDLKTKVLKNIELINTVETVSNVLLDTFRAGRKVLFAGNGGSAADAQHLASELSGRFYKDRDPLFAEALHTNTSYITAVANDYSYDYVYERLVKGMGRKGDVLIGISTSGNSNNIIKAFEEAKRKDMITIAFTGSSGGKMKELADYLINIPSSDTPRIQELHITLGHIICELVENKYFK